MNVRELRKALFELDQDVIVTVIDPSLHVDCHITIESMGEHVITIESTGTIVTEEEIA